jgi:hypothetical protein
VTRQPPRTLLPELEQLLASRPPHIAETVRRLVTDVRPCVALETTCASTRPIRAGWLDRLRHRPGATPVLPTTASKFGGTPYCERESELEGGRFLGQINFAEATLALREQQFPIPAGMPDAGLLAVDLVGAAAGVTSLPAALACPHTVVSHPRYHRVGRPGPGHAYREPSRREVSGQIRGRHQLHRQLVDAGAGLVRRRRGRR